jgi:hypothetical protein
MRAKFGIWKKRKNKGAMTVRRNIEVRLRAILALEKQ